MLHLSTIVQLRITAAAEKAYSRLGAGIDPGLLFTHQLVIQGSRGIQGNASLAEQDELLVQRLLERQLHHVAGSCD